MSGLIKALAEIVIFILEFIVDVVCFAVFLASLAGFWRWPFLFQFDKINRRSDFRWFALANMGAVLLDMFVFPFFLMAVCSWRVVRVIGSISDTHDHSFYTIERRGHAMLQFLLLLLDIPTIICFIFCHVTFWRIPSLYVDLKDEFAKRGLPLFECSRHTNDSDFRELIFMHAFNGFIDIFFVPFGLILLVTVYRLPIAYEDMKKELDLQQTRKWKQVVAKLHVCKQALLVLVDIPFMIMGLISVVLLFRAKAFLEDFSDASSAGERRRLAALHAALSIRDWLTVPLCAPLIASLYRAFFCAKGIKDAVTAWAEPTAMLRVKNVRVELPSRDTGLKVHITATRAPGFQLTPSSSVRLFIRNHSFWKGVGRVMGAAVESLGQTMLPLSLTPKYFDVTPLTTPSLSEDCLETVVIDFCVSASCKTIRKNANKLFAEYADIQLEYSDAVPATGVAVNGTLMTVKVNFDQFNNYVDNQMPVPITDLALSYDDDTRKGKRFCDVFWKHVVVEFGFLIFDIVALTFFLLLHLFPHRILRVYRTAGEGSLRRQLRKKVEAIAAFVEYLETGEDGISKVIDDAEERIRQRLEDIVPADDKERQTEGTLFRLPVYGWGRRSRYRYDFDSNLTVKGLVSQLRARYMKLKDANCEGAAARLDSYITALEDASSGLRNAYAAHFYNDMPFCEVLDGLVPSGQAVLEKSKGPQLQAKQDSTTLVLDDEERNLQRAIALSLEAAPKDTSATRDHTRRRLVRFYQQYKPDNISNVENILDSFAGREEELFATLVSKYGPEPQEQCNQEEEAHMEGTNTIERRPSIVEPNEATQPAVRSATLDVQFSEPYGPEDHAPRQLASNTSSKPAEVIAVCNELQTRLISDLAAELRDAEGALHASPWCGGKQGWPGVREVVVQEVGQLMYDFAACFCALLVIATVYRIIPLIHSITKVTNVRRACVRQVAEIGIDILYLWKIGVVLCFIRGIFTLPGDLVYYMLRKPSFSIARQVIDHHLSIVLLDLLHVLSLVIAWDTLRFAVATLVFGVFSPCVILESAFARWEDDHRSDWNACIAAFFLLLSSAWVIGVPVFVGYYVGQHNVINAPAAVYFGIMAAILYVGLLVAVLQRDTQVTSIQRNTVRSLVSSFKHIGLVFGFLLELTQLLGLVFSVSRPDMFGDTIGSGLEQASNYVFATFGSSWTRLGVPFGVYLSIVITIVYFIVSGAPVVCGDILHWRSSSDMVRSPMWMGAMEFFGQTLLLTVVRNMATLLVCDGDTNTLVFSYPGGGSSVSQCFQGALRSTTVFALIMLTYYVPTTLMKNQKFNTAFMRGMDVVTPQLYRCLTKLPIATCCVLCTLLYRDRTAVLIVLIVTMTWCVAVTVLYPRWFDSPMCSVETIGFYRLSMYVVVLACSCVMLAQLKHTEVDVAAPLASFWSLYVSIACIGAGILAGFINSVRLSRTTQSVEDSIEDVKQRLLEARQTLRQQNALRFSGDAAIAADKAWIARVRAATRCSLLAVQVKDLEQQSYSVQVSSVFLSTRPAWMKKVNSIIDEVDRDVSVDVDWTANRDWIRYAFCCSCCQYVTSHYDSYERDESDKQQRSEEERLIILQEVAMALVNAVMAEGGRR